MTSGLMMMTEEDRDVQSVELTELEQSPAKGRTLIDEHNELLRNVKVRLSVSVGQCNMTVKELLDLKTESVLTLDKEANEPVDVLLDGKLIARGHLVAVDDSFGVRISEIVAS